MANAKKEKKAPDFDSEKVEQLLAILDDLGQGTEFRYIAQASQMKLAEINLELWEELYPEEAEAKKKAEEEREKAEEERLKRVKEEEGKKAEVHPSATLRPGTVGGSYERRT